MEKSGDADEPLGIPIPGGKARVCFIKPIEHDMLRQDDGGALPRRFEVLVIPDEWDVWVWLEFRTETGDMTLVQIRMESTGWDKGVGGYAAFQADLRSSDVPKVRQSWIDAARNYGRIASRNFIAEPKPRELLAKKRGPAGPSARDIEEVVRLVDGGMSYAQVASVLPLSKSTAARWYALGSTEKTEQEKS